MRIQTVVVLTDFSAAAEQAVERAVLLALRHQARLELVLAAQGRAGLPGDAATRLEQRARQLSRRHGLTVLALADDGQGGLDTALQAAQRADLLVMDARTQGRWRWPTRATGMLAQVLRASACPVLVVQAAPRSDYAHALVHAISDADGELLRGVRALHAAATVELFHVARPLSGLRLACSEAFTHALQRRRRSASARPASQPNQPRVRVSDAFEARRNRVGLSTGRLDAVRQLAVQQQSTRADLLVLAQARRSVLRDLLQAGKAWRLLTGPSGVRCDVLLVPQPGRVAAAQRPGVEAPAQSAVARRWTQAT